MKTLIISSLLIGSLFASEIYKSYDTELPELKMPDNNLSFKMIDGYQDYKIVATHFRTDKNELRYILANPIGYNALKERAKVMPEGSKIVKIGWSVKKMPLFPSALEADEIQRVEYMVKDSKRFNADGDNWGYARFLKKGDSYESWKKGAQGCISCHSAAQGSDYLFTNMQSTFR
ncbi:MAG: cytochrome P460 family protein [Campylobacterota bacterium]|nr:cytochrome P460 family protein [Campylobacterota bacterium]